MTKLSGSDDRTIGWKHYPWGGLILVANLLDDHRGHGVGLSGFGPLGLNNRDSDREEEDAGCGNHSQQPLRDAFGFPASQGREKRTANLLGSRKN